MPFHLRRPMPWEHWRSCAGLVRWRVSRKPATQSRSGSSAPRSSRSASGTWSARPSRTPLPPRAESANPLIARIQRRSRPSLLNSLAFFGCVGLPAGFVAILGVIPTGGGIRRRLGASEQRGESGRSAMNRSHAPRGNAERDASRPLWCRSGQTTRSVEDGIPTQSVGTRGSRSRVESVGEGSRFWPFLGRTIYYTAVSRRMAGDLHTFPRSNSPTSGSENPGDVASARCACLPEGSRPVLASSVFVRIAHGERVDPAEVRRALDALDGSGESRTAPSSRRSSAAACRTTRSGRSPTSTWCS